MSHEEYMKDMLEHRVQTIQDRVDRYLTTPGERKRAGRRSLKAIASREFLKKHAVGVGVDICCGDFLIEGALGVDTRHDVIGTDYRFSGDDLSMLKAKELDYVVSNYIEAMPSTLRAMNEWHRCLKVGGTIALVCRDAESYKNPEGALKNRKRVHTFTKVTIAHYLSRAEFSDINVAVVNNELHVTARKSE